MPGDERGPVDSIRREFLARCCAGAGAAMIPASLRGLAFQHPWFASAEPQASGAAFHLHPHYRTDRPLDATLLKVDPALDNFAGERYAAQIEKILARWSLGLLQSPPYGEYQS